MLRRYRVDKRADDAIRREICFKPPEHGGILGSNDGKRITHFYFDDKGQTTGSTYSPDVASLNEVLRRWEAEDVQLVGVIHSHPADFPRPSGADIEYALRIMEAFDMDRFALLIAEVRDYHTGDAGIASYMVKANGTVDHLPMIVEEPRIPSLSPPMPPLWKNAGTEYLAKVEGLYPIEALGRKTAVIVGTGGAIGFAEDLARSGVGGFVLIDGDIFTASNIATQQAYIPDIGREKVEVLKERILHINPEAKVVAVPRFLDDNMSDEDFASFVGERIRTNPTDVLICACTDCFLAQARAAELALKYGTPYLAAQLYAGGEGGEINFSYPGVTVGGCPRCVLRSRYEAYANGYQNAVTSAGCPIFATKQLNALKGQIAMMLLLYREDERCRYSAMLDTVADRNLVQLRLSPTAGETFGLHIFDEAMDDDLAFFGEPVWIPQSPDEDCPLCHGNPDLSALRGSIADTREARP